MSCAKENCSQLELKAKCIECDQVSYYCQAHAGEHFSSVGHEIRKISPDETLKLRINMIRRMLKTQKLLISSEASRLTREIKSASQNALKILKNLSKQMTSINQFNSFEKNENRVCKIIDSVKSLFNIPGNLKEEPNELVDPVGIALDFETAETIFSAFFDFGKPTLITLTTDKRLAFLCKANKTVKIKFR